MSEPYRDDPHAAAILRLDGEIEQVKLTLADICGKSGSNGKLGALKDRVDKTESRKWAVVMLLAGTIVTVLGAAIVFGRWMGNVEADIEAIKAHSRKD